MKWHRRRRREQDLERELQDHLQLEAEELEQRGVAPDEASYKARKRFGNVTRVKEEVRNMWGSNAWEVFLAEVRHAFRNIQKSPGFALTVVLTLALGIGASTAVFTLVESVILKPLTYRNSGQLVLAWEHVRFLGNDALGPNPRHVDAWQSRTQAFSAFTLFRHSQVGLTTTGDRSQLTGAVLCHPNLFNVLEVQATLGRTFVPQDGTQGHSNVAVLTHAAWQRSFNGEPGIIGRTVRINDDPIEIIGVLPPNFHFPGASALRQFPTQQIRSGLPEPAVFLPAVFNLAESEWNGNFGNWITIGRLKPDTNLKEAESQLNTVLAQLAQDVIRLPKDNKGPGIRASLQPMQEAVVGASGAVLWLMMSAVLGLMLIACLNLANAQFGRSLARGRDAALRTALGAAKWRLLWNNLAENLVLTTIGGIAGVLLAGLAVKLIRDHSDIDLPRLSEVHLNRRCSCLP